MPDASSDQDKKPATLRDGMATEDWAILHEFWHSRIVCPECDWNWCYHKDGQCPTPEQIKEMMDEVNHGVD
jgi:hypothetical protein